MESPTLAGFQWFLANIAGITTTILDPNSTVVSYAYAVALENVSLDIQQASCVLYDRAVYNLATHFVIEWAQDVPGAPVTIGSDPPAPFFQAARKTWQINSFVPGVVQSTGDNGTSSSYVVQEAAKNFTLDDLQNLKTPYGRAYLAIAQKYGPTIWGSN